MTKYYPPAYARAQEKWRKEHKQVNVFVPSDVKRRIDDTVRILGNTSVSKWSSEVFLSLFTEQNKQRSVIESVEKSELIAEGMKRYSFFHLKQSLTGEFCKADGCGGQMVNLSYPLLNNDKVIIVPVKIAVCEKCGAIKEE